MSELKLRIYDGTRQLITAPAEFPVTIIEGNQTQRVRDTYASNSIDCKRRRDVKLEADPDPTEVYVMRWMAGRQAGVPEFAPMYTITG